MGLKRYKCTRLGCKINMAVVRMNQKMNAFTAETLRRKGAQKDTLKFLCEPLRLCALAVKSNAFIQSKTFVRTRKYRVTILMSLFLFALTNFTEAQEIDLLLKNGHVIDPANNINAQLDVAIAAGKII
jgi:hypothetical protein